MALARTEDAASTLTDQSQRVASRAKGQGQELATTAKGEAERVAGRARVRTRQVAQSTASDARTVVSHARDEAHVVLEEAAGQARRTLADTMGVVEQQTAGQLDRLAVQLQQLVGEANALAAGNPDEAEHLRGLVEEAAEKLESIADRVQNLGADIETEGLGVALRDLQQYARRRPGVFLLGALGGGFLIGRMIRSDQEDEDESFEDGYRTPVRGGRR